MPYYVYSILELEKKKQLEHLDTFDRYQDAKKLVRSHRAEKASDDAKDYRMIFARNQTEAETLLTAPREERVIGED